MSHVVKKYVFAALLCVIALVAYSLAVEPGTKWFGKDSHVFNLSLGAFSGFFVLIIQFLLDGKRDRELAALEATRIKKVLPTRDSDGYYRNLISEAKNEIIVLGVTASRFLADFGDFASPRSEKKVLLAALDRGVKVRFLLCDKEHVLDVTQENRCEEVRNKILEINGTRANKIAVKYYKHPPSLSMVVIDDDCLVGPVFPGKASANTPTIHAMRFGEFANAYVTHFEDQWNKLP